MNNVAEYLIHLGNSKTVSRAVITHETKKVQG
jgi:hypothetical protein